MQEHLEKKHGRFFKERWEEYSSLQCKTCEEKLEGKEAWGKVCSMEAEGPLENTAEVLRERKKNHEKLGLSLSITLGMICLDALVRDLRSLEQNNGKNQGQPGSDIGIGLGVRYLDDLVEGIRVSDQVQRKEDTGQRKSDSTDNQTRFVHSRGLVQPHTKGL